MHDWLKIPPQILIALHFPTGTPTSRLPNGPVHHHLETVGSTKTDPDVNSLVWQGP